jgi:hypothetical protein
LRERVPLRCTRNVHSVTAGKDIENEANNQNTAPQNDTSGHDLFKKHPTSSLTPGVRSMPPLNQVRGQAAGR